jgi:ubiquinone biosynthesis protein UbiJ
MLRRPLALALERAFQLALRLDPEAREGLEALAGRQIEVVVEGTGLRFCLAPLARRMRVLPACIGEPDVRMRAGPFTWARLPTVDKAEDLSPALIIEGDLDTGRRLYAWLRELDLDWEEWLARAVGDIPAHQAGNLARGAAGWLREAGASLEASLGEYLREESGLLPPRDEVERFVDEVDGLREAVDRLEARIRRLEKP